MKINKLCFFLVIIYYSQKSVIRVSDNACETKHKLPCRSVGTGTGLHSSSQSPLLKIMFSWKCCLELCKVQTVTGMFSTQFCSCTSVSICFPHSGFFLRSVKIVKFHSDTDFELKCHELLSFQLFQILLFDKSIHVVSLLNE